MNLRDKILNAKDIDEKKIKIEEWGVDVVVKSMTGKERATFLKNTSNGGELDFEKMYPELVIATCYDPDSGDKVFQKEDRDIINTKSAGAIEKIAKIALELSGLGEQSQKEIKKK